MMNRKMRRFRQELTETDAKRILTEGKYAVMALSGDEDYPYALPINFVFDGKSIYIHSAAKGHKIDAIIRNPKCSFCVVDKDDVVPEEFTSYFRSVIAFGKATIVDDDCERFRALKLMSDKYSPGIDPSAEIDRFFKVVCIIRIDLEHISGKEAKELVNDIKGPNI